MNSHQYERLAHDRAALAGAHHMDRPVQEAPEPPMNRKQRRAEARKVKKALARPERQEMALLLREKRTKGKLPPTKLWRLEALLQRGRR